MTGTFCVRADAFCYNVFACKGSSRRVTRGRVNTLPERAGAILIGKTSSATNRRRTVFNVGVRRRFFYAEVSGDAAKCGASPNRGLR